MPVRTISPPATYQQLFTRALPDLPGAALPGVRRLRRTGFERFATLGIPGPRTEAWKYTPASGFATREFTLPRHRAVDRSEIAPYLVEEATAGRLVFINGRFAPELSDPVSARHGMTVRRLADALAEGDADLIESLGDEDGERSFTGLNSAFLSDGLLIKIEPGTEASAPLQVIFVSAPVDGEAQLQNVGNVVLVSDGGHGHLVETHLNLGASHFVNVVNRARCGAGASLVHERLEAGTVAGSLVTRNEYDLAADSRLTQNVAVVGGGLVRNEIQAAIRGSRVEAVMNGLYLTRDGQHVDNALKVIHAAPDSMSDQFYKGVLDGRAKAAFAGQIVVERPAQKTNAYQRNNNLLLTSDAEINTKPELEIFADDVKCSHGATAGELDERELFYLRSRGLELETARSLLTYAFAGEVLERFVAPSFADMTRREVLRWLPGGAALRELI